MTIGAGSLDAAVSLVNKDGLKGEVWIPVHLVTPQNVGEFLKK